MDKKAYVSGTFLLSTLLVVTALIVSISITNLSSELLGAQLSSETSNTKSSFTIQNGEAIYLQAAHELDPVTDKVTTHTYQIMYGQYLLPYYQAHPDMKMLEIGLGCDMVYGPGASARLHKKLFPLAELWEAEFDASCVEKNIMNGNLKGFHTLVGDQGDSATLNKWIQESGGGNFDVIIDDGGHDNCQIWTSFLKLWPTLKNGGLYFIEDMQVAKDSNYQRKSSGICPRGTIVPDKIKDMVDSLLYDIDRKGDVKFVFCQSEACLIGKKD